MGKIPFAMDQDEGFPRYELSRDVCIYILSWMPSAHLFPPIKMCTFLGIVTFKRESLRWISESYDQ